MTFTTGKLRANLAANFRRERDLRRGVDPGPPTAFGRWLLDAQRLPPMLHQAKKAQERLEELISKHRETARKVKRTR